MISRGEIEKTAVGDIVIPTERWRKPSVQQIEVMRKSLRENGLLIPIAVRLVDEIIIDGAPRRAVPVLVHGATRLAAAMAEGWAEIDTQILEGSDVDFEKAEIAENLHRGELTKLDRDRQLARYIRLCEGEVILTPEGSKIGRGRPEGGVRAAARELSIPSTTAQKAVATESIIVPAAAAITELGLANSPSAYREVAAEPPHAQVAKVGEIAQRREQRRATIKPRSAGGDMTNALPAAPTGESAADDKTLNTLWAKANPGLPRGSEPIGPSAPAVVVSGLDHLRAAWSACNEDEQRAFLAEIGLDESGDNDDDERTGDDGGKSAAVAAATPAGPAAATIEKSSTVPQVGDRPADGADQDEPSEPAHDLPAESPRVEISPPPTPAKTLPAESGSEKISPSAEVRKMTTHKELTAAEKRAALEVPGFLRRPLPDARPAGSSAAPAAPTGAAGAMT